MKSLQTVLFPRDITLKSTPLSLAMLSSRAMWRPLVLCLTIVCSALSWKAVIQSVSKKAVCLGLSAFLVFDTPLGVDAAFSPLYGLKKDRLLPCKSKSNCFSSSSISSLDHYAKPWSFDSKDGDQEYQEIVKVLGSITEFPLTVVDKDASKRYVRAETRSAIPPTGIDDIEFLVNGLDNIITIRSNSREVVMAGPENIGDGGSNKNRLDVIRRKLGLEEMGVAASYDEKDLYQAQEKLGLFGRMNAASQPNDINFLDNSVGPAAASTSSEE